VHVASTGARAADDELCAHANTRRAQRRDAQEAQAASHARVVGIVCIADARRKACWQRSVEDDGGDGPCGGGGARRLDQFVEAGRALESDAYERGVGRAAR